MDCTLRNVLALSALALGLAVPRGASACDDAKAQKDIKAAMAAIHAAQNAEKAAYKDDAKSREAFKKAHEDEEAAAVEWDLAANGATPAIRKAAYVKAVQDSDAAEREMDVATKDQKGGNAALAKARADKAKALADLKAAQAQVC
jgi:hypothetical protein